MNEEEVHHNSVAAGSAVRVKYFDHAGVLRIAVILSTVPVSEVRDQAAEVRKGIEAYVTALGGIVLDISVDLEDRDPVVDIGTPAGACPPIRGAGFLQLATVHGRSVDGRKTTSLDLVLAEQDDSFLPTNIGEVGSIYG